MSKSHYRRGLEESRAAYACAAEESASSSSDADVRAELGRASYNLVLHHTYFPKESLAELRQVLAGLRALRTRHPKDPELASWTAQAIFVGAMIYAGLGHLVPASQTYAQVSDAEVDGADDPEVWEHQSRAALHLIRAFSGGLEWNAEFWREPSSQAWSWDHDAPSQWGQTRPLLARMESLVAAHPRSSDLKELLQSARRETGGEVYGSSFFLMDRLKTLADATYQAALSGDCAAAQRLCAQADALVEAKPKLKRLPPLQAKARHALALGLNQAEAWEEQATLVAKLVDSVASHPADKALRKQVALTLGALVERDPGDVGRVVEVYTELAAMAARYPAESRLQELRARAARIVVRLLETSGAVEDAAALITALGELCAGSKNAAARREYAQMLAESALRGAHGEAPAAQLRELAGEHPKDKRVAAALAMVEAHTA